MTSEKHKTRLSERFANFSTQMTPQNGSFYRYKRGKEILREAVNSLEKENRAKILPLAKKEKALTLGKCLIIFGGDEEGRTPDLCIANAALCQTELHPRFEFQISDFKFQICEN